MELIGRRAIRNRSAAQPTTATDKLVRRPGLPKARSTRENQAEPSRGQQKATANAITVRQPAISSSEGPCSGTEDKTISELFASCVSSYDSFRGLRSVRSLRVVRKSHFSSSGIEQR